MSAGEPFSLFLGDCVLSQKLSFVKTLGIASGKCIQRSWLNETAGENMCFIVWDLQWCVRPTKLMISIVFSLRGVGKFLVPAGE